MTKIWINDKLRDLDLNQKIKDSGLENLNNKFWGNRNLGVYGGSTFKELGLMEGDIIKENVSGVGAGWSDWYWPIISFLLIVLLASGFIITVMLLVSGPLALLPQNILEMAGQGDSIVLGIISRFVGTLIQILVILSVIYSIIFFISYGIFRAFIKRDCDLVYKDGSVSVGVISTANKIALVAFIIFLFIFGLLYILPEWGSTTIGLGDFVRDTFNVVVNQMIFPLIASFFPPAWVVYNQGQIAMDMFFNFRDYLVELNDNIGIKDCDTILDWASFITKLDKFYKQFKGIMRFRTSEEPINSSTIEEANNMLGGIKEKFARKVAKKVSEGLPEQSGGSLESSLGESALENMGGVEGVENLLEGSKKKGFGDYIVGVMKKISMFGGDVDGNEKQFLNSVDDTYHAMRGKLGEKMLELKNKKINEGFSLSSEENAALSIISDEDLNAWMKFSGDVKQTPFLLKLFNPTLIYVSVVEDLINGLCYGFSTVNTLTNFLKTPYMDIINIEWAQLTGALAGCISIFFILLGVLMFSFSLIF